MNTQNILKKSDQVYSKITNAIKYEMNQKKKFNQNKMPIRF